MSLFSNVANRRYIYTIAKHVEKREYLLRSKTTRLRAGSVRQRLIRRRASRIRYSRRVTSVYPWRHHDSSCTNYSQPWWRRTWANRVVQRLYQGTWPFPSVGLTPAKARVYISSYSRFCSRKENGLRMCYFLLFFSFSFFSFAFISFFFTLADITWSFPIGWNPSTVAGNIGRMIAKTT